MEYFIDAEQLMDKETSHSYLKSIFNFPEYYGNNLDALYDSLSELDDCTVWFENIENAGAYFNTIYTVFAEVSDDMENIVIQGTR